MKEENKAQSSNSQLSLEFSKSLSGEKPVQSQNVKVIRLSDHLSSDKPKIDYSKLVLKHTKSF